MLLIKLGGSIITRKECYASFREKRTNALVQEIMEALPHLQDPGIILVHGAGSFGHILAYDHEIHMGMGKATDHVRVVSQIKRDVRTLNSLVMDIVVKNSAHPIPYSPEAIFHKRGDNSFEPNMPAINNIVKMAEEGFLPVLFGDVVGDDEKLFAICSGDDIVEVLASRLEVVKKAIFVTNVDGIFGSTGQGKQGAVIDNISGERLVKVISKAHERTDEINIKDVTGNMYGKARKIRKIVRHCDVWVVNGNVKGRLAAAIKGEPHIGTHIHR